MINNDLVVSWIRTGVMLATGYVLSWAVRHGVPIGGLDDAQAATYVTPLVTAAWYFLVRSLEKKFPQIGWLFGVAKAPAYVPGPAPAPAAGEDAVAVAVVDEAPPNL